MQAFFEDQFEELKAIRYEFHRYPELGLAEVKTAEKIKLILTELDIPFVSEIGQTGIIATLTGKLPDNGRAVGLRADIDALPMQELSKHDHCSLIDGCMHACGHDGHMTILIAAAKYFALHRNFAGIIYFIFQPAEEGLGGADKMVKDGLFERFPMDAVYGLHNWPYIPAGKIAVLDGPAMAAPDRLSIMIHGRGGHGGVSPHLTIDPIRISASLVNALHTIVSRELPPHEKAVLSLCSLNAGSMEAFNVIPDTASLSGTVRTFSKDLQDVMESSIRRICEGIASTYGAKIDVDYQRSYPVTVNDPECAQLVRDVIEATFPEGVLDSDVLPSFGGEDFSFMLNACRGAYIFLGSAKNDEDEPLHSPTFDFNDDVIPKGAMLFVSVALRALSQPLYLPKGKG
ncbi:MAG: Hippurate hydrolase [Candidatus Celerinatantimonas neptuna]|nr:MAG: Hippurate hydrolase [Candidatus Celerinatantimonas neptuna]